MKSTKIYCDICGKAINTDGELQKYKIKKYTKFEKPYFLDVHYKCWWDLCDVIKEKQEELAKEKDNGM